MTKLRNLIRKKIERDAGDVRAFAKAHNIREATVYDLLNDKKSVGIRIVEGIMEKLNLVAVEEMPEVFFEVKSVVVDGKTYYKGDRYMGKSIMFLFGSRGTSYQCMILKTNNVLHLKVF